MHNKEISNKVLHACRTIEIRSRGDVSIVNLFNCFDFVIRKHVLLNRFFSYFSSWKNPVVISR